MLWGVGTLSKVICCTTEEAATKKKRKLSRLLKAQLDEESTRALPHRRCNRLIQHSLIKTFNTWGGGELLAQAGKGRAESVCKKEAETDDEQPQAPHSPAPFDPLHPEVVHDSSVVHDREAV